MSPSSIYLREQADKCRSHAKELQNIGDENLDRAIAIDSKETLVGVTAPMAGTDREGDLDETVLPL
jgi:hypothetical protein